MASVPPSTRSPSYNKQRGQGRRRRSVVGSVFFFFCRVVMMMMVGVFIKYEGRRLVVAPKTPLGKEGIEQSSPPPPLVVIKMMNNDHNSQVVVP